ncbi:hypothetical protein EUTSA_v10010512mg [Eutrema salsugineum]|uniref:Cytochrome P450 n=1 Tax=Eutrema salsugineum TaxID=72664 RepID=V4NGA1_EUTSA|nr:hypothetical protein EUTSA_v10010512mg [Eutrema salsugineum]
MSFFLAFVFLFPLSLFIFKKLSPSNRTLPPGPTDLPIIGNFHQLENFLHKSLHNLSLEHGPMMLLHFGVVPVVVFSSREAARTHDLETCGRPKLVTTKLFSYNFKDIGFAQHGEDWREMKKLVGLELFSPKKQKVFKYIREEESDFLVKKLTNSSQTETLVDLGKVLFSFTAGIIFRLAFGHNFRECSFIDMERVEEMVIESETNVGTLAITDFFPTALGWLIDRISGKHSRLNKGFEKLNNLFQHVIDDHLKNAKPEDQSDLVSAMLDIINKPTKSGSFNITHDHLKGVMSFIAFFVLDSPHYFNWSLPDGMTIADIDMDEIGALNIAKKVPLELVPTRHHL